ncbi:metal-dependent hydrolase [Halorubrum salipaludis]|uniref:Metal-dependent hydrolase n=1 Tax=Halorubrum salipaludis TaxID=2032630 RepID=A0A2A2F2A3_9EURY|nr:SprT family zinc-dependent metalloprotease [Halorubrum salipaludis]PAU79741.1 metal-dependent hydrolase [Halorubrum salipaludis]
MAETQRRQVDLLGESVRYDVRRSDGAAEPRIDVDIHGVTVVIPKFDQTSPEDLLRENAVWVVESKQKYDAYREEIPERNYEEGETFPYLGSEYEVTIERRPSSCVDEGMFRLARHHVEKTSVKRALETLYRRKARERFEERANYFAEEMGVEYDKIEVRNQRTKWGSCSTTGTLGLNWRLMMAPPEVINYVIIHELVHLLEQNHGQEFWNHVREYCPDYQEHIQWLEKNSTKLTFSHEDI